MCPRICKTHPSAMPPSSKNAYWGSRPADRWRRCVLHSVKILSRAFCFRHSQHALGADLQQNRSAEPTQQGVMRNWHTSNLGVKSHSLAHDALEEASHTSSDEDGADPYWAGGYQSGSIVGMRATYQARSMKPPSLDLQRTCAAKYLPDAVCNEPHVLVARDGDQQPDG